MRAFWLRRYRGSRAMNTRLGRGKGPMKTKSQVNSEDEKRLQELRDELAELARENEELAAERRSALRRWSDLWNSFVRLYDKQRKTLRAASREAASWRKFMLAIYYRECLFSADRLLGSAINDSPLPLPYPPLPQRPPVSLPISCLIGNQSSSLT